MILVCEPECRGFAHEQVNAAVIKSLLENGHEILFVGDKEHITCIKNVVDNNSLLERTTFIPIALPERSGNFFKQLRSCQLLSKKITELTLEYSIKDIIILSTNEINLLVFKFFIRKNKQLRLSIIIHGILEGLLNKSINIFNYKTFFKYVLKIYNPSNLSFIVLSPHIMNSLKNNYRKLLPKFQWLYHPYIYNNSIKKTEDFDSPFSFIGAFHKDKGAYTLINIAKNIQKCDPYISIQIIGINTLKKHCPSNIKSSENKRRLSRKEMDNLAKNTNYFIFTYPDHMYNYMASGALFDAFYYEKPIIALKHPMFQFYFNELGDIGYLCENEKDIENKIIELNNRKLDDRYYKQVENLNRIKKEIFEIQNKDFFKNYFQKLN